MKLTRLSIALSTLVALVALVSCAKTPTTDSAKANLLAEEVAMAEEAEADATAAQITLGNGKANWIIVEGASRADAILTFREVHIDGNGWLVMHPFKDGKPVGDIYVGHTYVRAGDNQNVEITVDPAPSTGDMFIVMLHRDVNENQEFDFVFVDEVNVLDKAVFEGSMMIAHAIAAP
jgi:hypothetical protein